VVHLASGKTLLIDAGSSTISDPARTCLIPYLKRFGVARIDSAFISHANHDHLNAIEDTALHLGLHHVYVSPFFHSHAAGNPPAESLLQTLDHLGHLPIVLSAGQRLAIDNTTTPTLDVLWPATGRALDANNSSLVLRLTVNGRSILFPGDIQEPAQRQLLGRPALLRSDILIAPHHGSSEPTTADLLRVVNPSIILASNDDRLSQKQRNLETLASARRLYRTHRSGAITVVISPDGQMNVDTFLAPR
jgi:competence protein ComEC